jgi:hypothetical protein
MTKTERVMVAKVAREVRLVMRVVGRHDNGKVRVWIRQTLTR